jgi:hypothetical protein
MTFTKRIREERSQIPCGGMLNIALVRNGRSYQMKANEGERTGLTQVGKRHPDRDLAVSRKAPVTASSG